MSLVEDADDGSDALGLPELERRLKVSCKDYFDGQVTVETVMSGKSHESPLLQLADLFSGAVARVLNPAGAVPNQKDEFAAFLQSIAGFQFDGAEPVSSGDFIYVHRL